MDKLNKNFLGEAGVVLFILLLSIALYLRYPLPSVLLGGALAVTFWVIADIVLFRKGQGSTSG